MNGELSENSHPLRIASFFVIIYKSIPYYLGLS